jgi:cold shock CspA family protein
MPQVEVARLGIVKDISMTGIVTSDSTKGYCFIESDETHQSVFCHISQVKDNRCLHTGDRVRFELIDNPVRRRELMAGNAEYIGRTGVDYNKVRP